VDPNAVSEFDYRRVYATGRLRHDQEMLIGPRLFEGHDGFLVITPLERGGGGSTVLVNRGWISKDMQNQKDRKEGLPNGEITVEGLLRSPWKKNMFTPKNKPEEGKFYFPDVKEMAEWTGSQPIWIEETMGKISVFHNVHICVIKLKLTWTLVPELLQIYHREERGIPIGRAPEVSLRNNHTQYIFTW